MEIANIVVDDFRFRLLEQSYYTVWSSKRKLGCWPGVHRVLVSECG